jgi:hypothetical protein
MHYSIRMTRERTIDQMMKTHIAMPTRGFMRELLRRQTRHRGRGYLLH